MSELTNEKVNWPKQICSFRVSRTVCSGYDKKRDFGEGAQIMISHKTGVNTVNKQKLDHFPGLYVGLFPSW